MNILSMVIILSLLYVPIIQPPQAWVIQSNSSIAIEGKSNINKFRCEITNYDRRDTILISKRQERIDVRGGFEINVNDFNCRNRFVSRDLRKTLNAKEFPSLKIKLLTLSNFGYGYADENINGWVVIELAGITRTIAVDYLVKHSSSGILQLCGNQAIQLSEFDLNCDDKLAGLIKVDDRINVKFVLNLKCL